MAKQVLYYRPVGKNSVEIRGLRKIDQISSMQIGYQLGKNGIEVIPYDDVPICKCCGQITGTNFKEIVFNENFVAESVEPIVKDFEKLSRFSYCAVIPFDNQPMAENCLQKVGEKLIFGGWVVRRRHMSSDDNFVGIRHW